MNPESDVLRLRDPSVLANRFDSTSDTSTALRLPAIRFETVRASRLERSLRCITPAHVLFFALAVALLTLAERLTHPLHIVS